MEKKEKANRQQQEDAALHNVLYWMGGIAILVFLLRLAQRYYVDFESTEAAIDLAWNIGRSLPWLGLGGAVVSVAGFAWAGSRRNAGKKTLFPRALGLFALGLMVCALGVWRLGASGVLFLTYAMIGMGILAMLYYLYQRDFVVVGFLSGLSMMGLWLFFREGRTARLYLAFVGILLVVVSIAGFVRYLQQRDGVLCVKERRFELLPKGTSYALVYITCALTTVVLAAALIVGGGFSHMLYYAVPVAWCLIMAVYYTVKLM